MSRQTIRYSRRAAAVTHRCERALNAYVRGRDRVLERLHLGGRKADYDDQAYEFVGGPADGLRKKHYDKSLRLLWKAQANAPWLDFRDASRDERTLMDQALRAMNDEEKEARKRLSLPEYKALLDREYSYEQKEAIDRLAMHRRR